MDSNRGAVVRLTRTGILDLLRHIDRLNLKGKTWKLHIFRLNIFTTSTTNRATTWKMLCISFRANNYLLTYDKDILSSENVLQLLWKIFWIRLSKTGLVCWKKNIFLVAKIWNSKEIETVNILFKIYILHKWWHSVWHCGGHDVPVTVTMFMCWMMLYVLYRIIQSSNIEIVIKTLIILISCTN